MYLPDSNFFKNKLPLSKSIHCKMSRTLICALLCGMVTNGDLQQYHGILINGNVGTQLYDPFNSPHALGNLQLGLQAGLNAWFAAAVIDGPLAYFASGFGSANCYFSVIRFDINTHSMLVSC